MKEITLSQLFEAGAHFGHKTKYWDARMAPYIYGENNGIHIINLDKTVVMANQALQFISRLVERNEKILFVGTKTFASEIIREEAERCGMPYVDHRWLGGMLTNYATIRKSITSLKSLEKKLEEDGDKFTKKERLGMERQRAKLSRVLSGIKDMENLPAALFVIDVHHEKIAITEAVRLGNIKVVGVVDSNSNPENVDYPIPANDDSRRSIKLFAQAVADTIIESATAAKEHAAKQRERRQLAEKSAKLEKIAAAAEKSATPSAPESSSN